MSKLLNYFPSNTTNRKLGEYIATEKFEFLLWDLNTQSVRRTLPLCYDAPCNHIIMLLNYFRPGHSCPYSLTVASILMYEAVHPDLADVSYKALRKVSVNKLGRYLVFFVIFVLTLITHQNQTDF